MIEQINLFIRLTRMYALPMSVLSWFVAFAYSSLYSNNIVYGLIALVGICLAHLGVNTFDDFADYYQLKKGINDNNDPILLNSQMGKCECLLNKEVSPKQMFGVAFLLFGLAFLIGIFFILKVGLGVLTFMILGGFLGLIYPILGKFRLCEVALSLIYGPILFSGVFYVMNGVYDWRTLIVCIPTMIMTLNLLYTDTMMDYDIDINEGKKTIANFFATKLKSLNFQKYLITIGYLSILLVYFFKIGNWKILLTFGTLPIAIKLVKTLKTHIEDNSYSFMYFMLSARNLMICFSLIFGLALLSN